MTPNRGLVASKIIYSQRTINYRNGIFRLLISLTGVIEILIKRHATDFLTALGLSVWMATQGAVRFVEPPPYSLL